MQRTIFYNLHKGLGAKMIDFGGWEMPVYYTSIRDEHNAVRNGVGIFDVSHMGEIVVRGEKAFDAVQGLVCNDLGKVAENKCQYSALLTPEGTFVDDIIIYPLSRENILICVNASNAEKDFRWIREHVGKIADVTDESDRWCQVAIQGPDAGNVLQGLTNKALSEIKTFHFCMAEVAGLEVMLSRTGYTGEYGFEIYARPEDGPGLWEAVMKNGEKYKIRPCGLGARDTLRLEATYPLYGHEIGEEINPFEARLGWIVRLDKGDFVGKEALEKIKKEGPKRMLVGFTMDDGSIPRKGYRIYLKERELGEVASGTLSPTLEVGIGTALAPRGSLQKGGKIDIDIRGKKRKATTVSLPFYENEERWK